MSKHKENKELTLSLVSLEQVKFRLQALVVNHYYPQKSDLTYKLKIQNIALVMGMMNDTEDILRSLRYEDIETKD